MISWLGRLVIPVEVVVSHFQRQEAPFRILACRKATLPWSIVMLFVTTPRGTGFETGSAHGTIHETAFEWLATVKFSDLPAVAFVAVLIVVAFQ